MKVLMIDQWLPAQPYTLELSRKLSKHADLTLAAPKYYRPDGEGFRCKSVLESKVKEKKSGLLSYFRGVLWLLGAALFGKYDVIHIQAFKQQDIEMPVFELARRVTKKKLVYTAHNILPHEKGGQREADRLKKWYSVCDAIVVHNEFSKQTLIDFAPDTADRIRVMPHGTFDIYEGMAQEKKHEKTVFLMFGMLRKYKGIDNLLKAASLLPEESRKRFQIIIAGNQRKDQDDTDYRALLEKAGVEDFVKLNIGRVPDDQVPDLFNSADCCLFPYKEIYGSGALLMAYSFEKPVIVSGIPTFVEETDSGATGLVYDPKDERALAEAMIRFASLSEQQIADMKRNIRRLCRDKYNWEISAQTLVRIYETLIKS